MLLTLIILGSSSCPLQGLCMSGCEEEVANKEFERNFIRKYPNIAKSCMVASDTIGPLYSASPKGNSDHVLQF